jgi:hypothetical protein
MWTGIRKPLPIDVDSEYTFLSDFLCLKTNSEIEGRIEVYLDGPVFSNGQSKQLGLKIAELRSPPGQRRRSFNNFLTNFVGPNSDLARLRFVIYSGEWYISNIRLVSSRETGFNPDEITILAPVVGRRFERLQFKAELYDANSNLVPLNIETDPIYFDGGNLVFRGADTRIDGILTVASSGSGISMGSIASGSFLGIGSGNVSLPINPGNLNSYSGTPYISMYSGTFLGTPQLGFQLVSPSGSEISYLDFNSLTRKLTIRGDIQVLPNTSLSESIYSGTLTSTDLIALANGTRPGGTFINGTGISSPNIVGNNGFISQRFGVGNIAGGNGIILSALGFTSSMSVPVPNAPTIYIGQGTFFNSNTPFIVASSSAGPVLSLSDKLKFEPSSSGGSTLLIRGQVLIEDPITNQVSDFNDVRKVIANRIAFGPFGFYISNL